MQADEIDLFYRGRRLMTAGAKHVVVYLQPGVDTQITGLAYGEYQTLDASCQTDHTAVESTSSNFGPRGKM